MNASRDEGEYQNGFETNILEDNIKELRLKREGCIEQGEIIVERWLYMRERSKALSHKRNWFEERGL